MRWRFDEMARGTLSRSHRVISPGSCVANWMVFNTIMLAVVIGLWVVALVTAILSKALEHD